MRKIFSKLHLWLSLPFGVIIAILCLTGGLLVFETELLQLTNPSLYYVKEVKDKPIQLEQLLPIVQKQLPDSVSISGVTISSDPKDNYRMSMTGQRRVSLTVDQYTGEVRGKIIPYAPNLFFSTVRKLHRWFMFPMKREGINWGKIITGTSTLMFIFVLVTGIVIWVPKTYRMLKRRLSIKVNAGSFRFLYDIHIAGGAYAVIFLLAMSLTGLTWSFGWYRTGFYKVLGVEMMQGGHGVSAQQSQQQTTVRDGNTTKRNRNHEGDSVLTEGRPNRETGEERGSREGRGNRGGRGEGRKRTNYAIWENVYTQLTDQYSCYKSISIQNGSASVALQTTGNSRASDRYTFDSVSGELTPSQLYKDTPKSGKIQGWIYAVHVGSWGGTITRVLYLIACLIGTALPITGYYFYIRKLRLKKKKKSRA